MCTRKRLISNINLKQFERTLLPLPIWKSLTNQEYDQLNNYLKSLPPISARQVYLVFKYKNDLWKSRSSIIGNNPIDYEYQVGLMINRLQNPIFIRTLGLIQCYEDTKMKQSEIACLRSDQVNTKSKWVYSRDIITTEYFEGTSLADIILDAIETQNKNQLLRTYKMILSIMLYVIDTISHIKFTHYNLIPNNIIVSKSNEVVIQGFENSYIGGLSGRKWTSDVSIVDAITNSVNPNIYDPYFDIVNSMEVIFAIFTDRQNINVSRMISKFRSITSKLGFGINSVITPDQYGYIIDYEWLSNIPQNDRILLGENIPRNIQALKVFPKLDYKSIDAKGVNTKLKFYTEDTNLVVSRLLTGYKLYKLNEMALVISPHEFRQQVMNLIRDEINSIQ